MTNRYIPIVIEGWGGGNPGGGTGTLSTETGV